MNLHKINGGNIIYQSSNILTQFDQQLDVRHCKYIPLHIHNSRLLTGEKIKKYLPRPACFESICTHETI